MFRITSSPHIHQSLGTNRIMFWVIFACLPGIGVQMYHFGYGNLIQILLAMLTATFCEAFIGRLRKQPILDILKDNSALVTAILLGISLPPLAPWWVVVSGTAIAIILAKQLYGGIGQNLFNPAMVGYVSLLISFPVQMTNWSLPIGTNDTLLSFIETCHLILRPVNDNSIHIDAITQATPLDFFKSELSKNTPTIEILQDSIYTNFINSGWSRINFAFLIGGGILWMRNIIQWQIPFSIFIVLSMCSLISWSISPELMLSPTLQLFSGGTMLGIFFIATDPVTASTTSRGKLIFGALVGFFIWLIRSYGTYPDAIAFSILLANLCVPLIDHLTRPKAYGQE